MAESTLSIQFSELQREVAHFAGWDRDPTNWTADHTTDFGDILKRGLRMFYYPPAVIPDQPRYEWSFLRPTVTLAVSAAYTDLPDDFSGTIIDDSPTLGIGSGHQRLKKISAQNLLALQSANDQTATPLYYAIRTKAHAPTTGLRYELGLYPTPSSETVTYQYVVAPDNIDATNKYPIGGAIHSETILEAVLAAAENKLDDDPAGPHMQAFMTLLAQSIRADKEHKMFEEEITT